jgi:RES domain-containing protein
VTPLPPPLGDGSLVLWRLDRAAFAESWDSGEGAYRFGGRWNSVGVKAVYASLDPATAILEVAVHATFASLDAVRHVLTSARIADPATARVVQPGDIPNPNWLRPGEPSAGQQAFGDSLLRTHALVLIPSVVSTHSWNVVFAPGAAAGLYGKAEQAPFSLDTRLHPPARRGVRNAPPTA